MLLLNAFEVLLIKRKITQGLEELAFFNFNKHITIFAHIG